MEKSILRTVGELPSHTHTASVNTAALAGTWNAYANAPNTSGIISSIYYGSAVQGGSDASLYRYSIDVSHSHSVTISSAGTNQHHQNMQPFFVIYCWKRIV